MINPNKLGRSPFPAGASQWMLVGLRGGAVTPVHLLNTLISYWKLDEASGTRSDSQGINNLTTGGGSIGVAGKINNAAHFVAASGQSLGAVDNSSLRVTSDFTFSFWLRLTSNTVSMAIISKDDSTGGRDYLIYYHNTVGIVFSVTDPVTIAVAQGTTIATAVWTHVVVWWDSADSKLRLRINDASTIVSSMTGALIQTAQNFGLGVTFTSGGSNQFLDGDLDEVGFWKRKLNTDEITALYNGGAGLPFSSFTA